MAGQTKDREQQIREQAYALWEKEGRPSGRDQEFWERACRLQDEMDRARRSPRQADSSTEKEDVASIESFPASDPPGHTPIKGASGKSGE